MAWLKQLKDQFFNLWKGFDNQTKILLGTVLFAVIIGLAFLVNWAGKPEYVTLYSGLADKDASTIVAWLKESGIDYKLEAGGSTISVPRESKYQARIDLAGEGLTPRGGAIGFEIFDTPKIGATDKERSIQYARAVAGEMQRSIELIDGVEFARVSVSIPEKSLFVDEEQPATASVLLKLRSGVQLSQQNVSAITHLVAGGVEGLAANHVSIIDTNGNILSQAMEGGMEDFGQVASTQFQAQRQVETKVRNDLMAMLGKVFGPNNVVVTVSAKMNFDKKNIVETIYKPVVGDEGIIRSEQSTKEQYTGTGSNPSGVPGTESNIPMYQSNSTNSTSSEYKKEQVTKNYDINSTQTQQTVAPGVVEKLSVAVVINKDLDDTLVTNVEKLVSSAVNFDPVRGDTLSVVGMAFDNSLELEYENAMAARRQAETQQLMIGAGAAFAGFILLWLIFRASRKKSLDHSGGRVNVLVGDVEAEMAATMSHELSPEEKARMEMRKEIADLISNKPEDVAELLKTWLTED